jgi:Ca-activated chloride channel family protein
MFARQRKWTPLAWASAALLFVLAAVGCSQVGPEAGAATADTEKKAAADPNVVELTFTYGSEKKSWIEDVTREFNAAGKKLPDGRTVRVNAIPLGSGECVEEVLAGRRETHITSPASGAYVEIGNGRSQKKNGGDLLGKPKYLVRSPVVIAMWKPMAEALGYGKKPVGWADVLGLVKSDKGWGDAGKPQWGQFRFGHTHPEHSNSGLITALAEVYASTKGKTDNLTPDDVKNAGQFMEDIEKGIVHYGESTGFFADRMFSNDVGFLNAAVVYENLVIESYDRARYPNAPAEVVAIYPKEGTFWSDHPLCVVQRKWVTDAHKKAAEVYADFLLEEAQQKKAMRYGFRPGVEKIELAAPLDKAHGIDPAQPRLIMEVPSNDVMEAVIDLWKAHKKPSHINLVIDFSGSMNEEQKLLKAKKGAQDMVNMLGPRDTLSLMVFSDKFTWVRQDVKMDEKGRKEMIDDIGGLIARGETALYDSVFEAYRQLQKGPQSNRITAVVVLTDGEDNKSKFKTVEDLLKEIKFDPEKNPTRVYTIAYGRDANRDVLKKIAEATKAKSYDGSDIKTIQTIFKDVAMFF